MDIILLDREVIAIDGVRFHLLRPGVLRLRLQVFLALDRVPRSGRQHASDERQIRVIDARTSEPGAPLFFGAGAVAEPGEAAQRERVDAQQLRREVVLHVAAHALHDRNHCDQEHDADANAEEREEAFQLLHADLRQSQPDCLDERHGQSFLLSSGGAIPAALMKVARFSSLATEPSRRTITRRAWAAISDSWVTMMTVCPRSACAGFDLRVVRARVLQWLSFSARPIQCRRKPAAARRCATRSRAATG